MKKSTSPEAYLRRTVRLTVITGVFLALGVAARWGWSQGIGFGVGLAWGVANFIALAMVVRSKLSPTRSADPASPAKRSRSTDTDGGPDTRSRPRPGMTRSSGMKVALVVAFKIGMYGAALVLLATGWVPPLAFATGFTWLLAVILLRALGQWWIDSNATRGSGNVTPQPPTANEDVQKR